jgi:hypothetical protein
VDAFQSVPALPWWDIGTVQRAGAPPLPYSGHMEYLQYFVVEFYEGNSGNFEDSLQKCSRTFFSWLNQGVGGEGGWGNTYYSISLKGFLALPWDGRPSFPHPKIYSSVSVQQCSLSSTVFFFPPISLVTSSGHNSKKVTVGTAKLGAWLGCITWRVPYTLYSLPVQFVPMSVLYLYMWLIWLIVWLIDWPSECDWFLWNDTR